MEAGKTGTNQKQAAIAWLLLPLVTMSSTSLAFSLDPIFELLTPGMGLQSNGGDETILLFEHTSMGSGGLVLQCPTPLRLKDIPVERFRFYGHLPLMLGSGLAVDDKKEEEVGIGGSDEIGDSNIPLSDMSPWFWLHDLPDIPGSLVLEAAAGPLFMGGNLQAMTDYLTSNGTDPLGHVAFFREYKSWGAGVLLGEIKQEKWRIQPMNPSLVLQGQQSI